MSANQDEGFDSEDELPLTQVAEMTKMMQQIEGGQNVNLKDFIDIDKNLQLEDDKIEISLPSTTSDVVEIESEDEEEAAAEESDNQCGIKSYSEALESVRQLKVFSLKNSDVKAFETLSALQMHFEHSSTQRKTRQALIGEYFRPINE